MRVNDSRGVPSERGPETCTVKLKRRRFYKSSAAAQRHAHLEAFGWNATHASGAPVCVHRDSGEILPTRTRSTAQVLCDTAVVWVDGISGAYALFAMHDRAPEQAPQAAAESGPLSISSPEVSK